MKLKSAKFWIAVALCLCLISMIGASVIQSSFNTVRVRDMRIILDDGYSVNAQLFVPKKASVDNKLPLIVTCHGAFNNLNMQDQNLIELSRRGFVVLAYDAYGHGSSSLGSPLSADFFERFGLHKETMIGLVEYACQSLNFIDVDKVAISGHSMGSGISRQALPYFVERQLREEEGVKLAAILTVGLDPEYAQMSFEGLDPVYPPINWGVIAGAYDEWNFQVEDVGFDPRRYLESSSAISFINQLEEMNITSPVESGKHYTGTIDGEEYLRVIYQNKEIHPKNIFSAKSAASAVDFFYAALGVPSGYTEIAPTNQIWQWKQAFNCLGLIGILLFLVPFASIMIDSVPYFSELKGEVCAKVPVGCDGKRKLIHWILFAIYAIIPPILVTPIMVTWIGKGALYPETATNWFGLDGVNEVAVWSAIVAALLLIAFLAAYYFYGKKNGQTICGGKISGKLLWKSVVLSALTVTVAYVILFSADLLFNVDFRLWLISMKVFTVDKVLFLIAYIPAFVIFYIVNSLIVNVGDNLDMPDWLATLKCCIANVGGLFVMVLIQYVTLMSKGYTPYNAMRLVNVLPLFVMVPVATIVSRKLYKKTGNIYIGALICAILFTMMTVTNTQCYGSILGLY